jgi:hypothetical protein
VFETTKTLVKGVDVDVNWSLCGVYMESMGVCLVPL